MQMVEDRCGGVFDDIESIIPRSQLAAHAEHYKQLSGFSIDTLNAQIAAAVTVVLIAFALPGKVDWAFIPAAPLFGLDPALGEDARITGPISAVWYFIFILPMFLFTPDAANRSTNHRGASPPSAGIS